jgi:c-di-GMP-binding flagellar brake protein YcgR
VTAVNGIRVQFSSSGRVKQVRWGDADALAVSLPARVLRLQRREAYRIVAPVVNGLSVQLQSIQHGVYCDQLSLIHNLSVFGFCAGFSQRPDLEVGQKVVRITFALPEWRVIEGEGVVRHVTEFADVSGKQSYRVGVAFKDLPRSMEVAIQRYIIELEHARRNMSLG